jgi:GTPase SAR1 family protein
MAYKGGIFMKSPKQLRSDIQTLTSHLSQVQEGLLSRSGIKVARIGKECRRTADALGVLLKSQQVPASYKVAVVGRFKSGKSSFVNELLNTQLANEGTLPETAAITTFRHGQHVKASIRFVSQDKWSKLNELYAEDAKHVDAHRVKNWLAFGKPKKPKEGEPEEVFDLPTLQRLYIKAGGHTHTVELASDASKKAASEFRRKLKEFTSATSPLHCLVESIDITAPAEILDQGVLLIDTPGLDDTERFRVSLTEQVVQDVDAVLFLTKSGVSYSQSEKDFLLSLLRKGTVKQLIVVITQVDQTYDQHVRAAEDDDEPAETLAQRIEKERRRISAEITATLNDLSQDESLVRYREQLGEVPIRFTSARLHRDWKAKKPLACAIDNSDPGGVDTLKAQLLQLLSTQSRLAQNAQNIVNGGRTSLLGLQSVLQAKLQAIRNIKDKEVAELKLNTFRDEFGKASERFDGAVKQQVKLLSDRLIHQRTRDDTLLENIGLLAEQQLAAFEIDDAGRHWRTRRSGNWGYMRDFQNRVANHIFPKVQQMLGEHTQQFSEFVKNFEVFLNRLSQDGARISEHLELGDSLPFDVTGKLKVSLERSLQRAQELTAAEELKVTTLLDDFVSDEVSDRITARRTAVANIWGVGTTWSQTTEVRSFYREVKDLLKAALQQHLRDCGQRFGDFLVEEAQTAPRDAIDEVNVLLEQTADNIRAAATEHLAEQKESVEALVAAIDGELAKVLTLTQLLLPDAPAVPRSMPVNIPKPPELMTASVRDESAGLVVENSMQDIQQRATVVVARLHLREDATGWGFERLFEARLLSGALRMTLIDPYLAKSHQLRHLCEFLMYAAEVAHPKEIEIITTQAPEESVVNQERVITKTTKDLFNQYGVALSLRYQAGLHDRYLVLDHGVLFKLGRGLDFYKPATGLAAHRPANRRVRETEIDVFTLPGHALSAPASV